MPNGNAQDWVNRFISFDDRFLKRVAAMFPACLELLPETPKENDITINLVACLAKDKPMRRLCHWVEYQFEPFGHAADGSKFSKNIIEIAVFFNRERDRYLAYECKRLNVNNGGSRKSLATEYVTQGMMRFVTEQYAEDLPFGCMLGYVLDGDVPFAQTRIAKVIERHAPLNLTDGPTPLTGVETVERFQTKHSRPGGSDVILRHALIAVS